MMVEPYMMSEQRLAIVRKDEFEQRWRFFLQEVSEIAEVRLHATQPPPNFLVRFNDAYAVIGFYTLSKFREDEKIVVPDISYEGQSIEERTRMPDVMAKMRFEDARQFFEMFLTSTMQDDLFDESVRYTSGLDELDDKAAGVLEELEMLMEKAESGLLQVEEAEALLHQFQEQQTRLETLMQNPKFKRLFAELRSKISKAAKGKPSTEQGAGQETGPTQLPHQRGGGGGRGF